MEIQKSITVAFTGYRTSKFTHFINDPNLLNIISAELYITIELLYEQGFTTYLSGMAEGFDMMAAEAVLALKEKHSDIQLIAVIPFQGQELHFNCTDKLRYKTIYDSADNVFFTSEFYHEKAFFVRNDYLLDNCSQVVCYYDGQKGGTMYTVNRAVKASLPIINIYEELCGYFSSTSHAKETLKHYHYLKQMKFNKEGFSLRGIKGEPITVNYQMIKSIEKKQACLYITLFNGTVFRISTISTDFKVKLPEMNPNTLTLLWWILSGWACLIHKKIKGLLR